MSAKQLRQLLDQFNLDPCLKTEIEMMLAGGAFTELTDADLEQIAAGKGGGGGGRRGGGGGGDPVLRGFARLNAFSDWQWRNQRNTGTNWRTYGGRRV